MRLSSFSVLGLPLLLISTAAHAQNMRDVPLGARTATMGGTAIALGNDSAMPFLNPAGIAGTPIDTLSVSATAYSFVTARVPKFFNPNGLSPTFGTDRVTEEDGSSSQFAALPTGLAYYAHFGTEKSKLVHVLGISVTVPSYEDRSIDASLVAEGPGGRVSATQVSERKFRMVFLGPSYALRSGDDWRFGVSVLAYYSDVTIDQHQLFSRRETGGVGPRFLNNRTRLDAACFGLTAIVGAQHRVIRDVLKSGGDLWAGLAFETRGIPLTGGGDLISTADSAGVNAGAQVVAQTSATGEIDMSISRPFRISVGAAYEKPSKFALAADLNFHPPIPDVLRATGSNTVTQVQTGAAPIETRVDTSIKTGTRFVVNPSIGAEIQPFEKVAFRTGVFTDFDVVDDVGSDGRKSERLNWYGASFGVGHKTDPLGATYGVIYRYGRGTFVRTDDLGPNPTQEAEIEYTAHGFMAVLSATLEIGAPVDAFARYQRRRQM